MTDRNAERLANRCKSLRDRYVTANEGACRACNRGAPADVVAAAEAERDRAGDAWERCEVERAALAAPARVPADAGSPSAAPDGEPAVSEPGATQIPVGRHT